MSVYIEGIGNPKISYKNPEELDFYSLSEYLTLAKKSISKFANSFYGGLARKMLKDEDAISNVAYSLMLADWRYDENYNSDDNRQKTQYSYRNQCAIWAIQSYITKNYKKSKMNNAKIYSLDYNYNEDHNNSYKFINDKSTTDPTEALEKTEEQERIKNFISNILNSSDITDRQKEYIQLYYYSGKTFDQIGKQFSLTREAVRQSIKKAIAKIQEKHDGCVR